MKVLHEDTVVVLQPQWPPQIEDDGLVIELRSGNGLDSIYIRVPRIIADFDEVVRTEYRVDLFRSVYWQENTFSNVRTKVKGTMKSIGYLFPLSTLISQQSILIVSHSDENGKADENEAKDAAVNNAEEQSNQDEGTKFAKNVDDFVRGYAIAAILALLHNATNGLVEKPVSWGQTYSLTNFFSDDLVLAIYDPARIDRGNLIAANSAIDQYSIVYTELKTYEWHSGKLKGRDPDLPFNNELIVHVSTCKNPKFNSIIQYLKINLIKIESTDSDSLVRFFMQYQFFEMVMHEVFASVLADFLIKVQRYPYNENAWKTKSIVGKLNEKAGENFRIGRIFEFMRQKYQTETEIIDGCCKDLLSRIAAVNGGGTIEDVEELKLPYYKLRNAVFHGFATSGLSPNDLGPVCDAVGELIFKIAMDYEDAGLYFN